MILGVIDQIVQLQTGGRAHGGILIAGIEYDEVDKVQNFFKRTGADIQKQTHTAGDAFEIPDVGDRGGQFNVTHTLTAYLCAGNLYAALVTDLVLVLIFDTLVLSAGALPVLGRSENAFAVKAVSFGTKRTIVNGFGFRHFAV